MKRDRRRKKIKEEQNKRRFEAIKNLMSTFAMGTVAVVAVVTLIPQSAKAEITKAVALENEIVYQVNVTDQDNSLDLESLNVVLENQLEFYEQPIQLGENTGYFQALNDDTQYRLSVYGNKGYGQERLDTVMITTEEKIGGTILSVDVEEYGYNPSYFVNLYINDPEGIYSSFTLYYGYSEHYHYEEEFEEEPEMFYSSILITDPDQIIEIYDVYTTDSFHIYLEGMTEDGPEILDEIWVTPPFTLYASFYLDYIDYNEIGFVVYNDFYVEDISYILDVYKGDSVYKQDTFIIEDDNYEGSSYIVDNLQDGTTYTIVCTARYVNPQTLSTEEKIIYQEELTTLTDDPDDSLEEDLIGGTILSVEVDENDYEPIYSVSLSINDPESIYSSITLHYGYTEFYYHEEEFEEDPDMIYSSILITNPNEIIELYDVYTAEPFHIYLEGMTNDGPVLLDETWVTPPLSLFSSFFLENINDTEMTFSIYNDANLGDLTYTVDIYDNGLLYRQDTFTVLTGSYYGYTHLIDGLVQGTTYTVVGTVFYENPYTLEIEESVLYEEEVTTLSNYSVTYDIEEFIEYMVITIQLDDPNNIFDYVYYEMYDVSGVDKMYLSSNSTYFIDNGSTKDAEITIYYNTLVNTETIISIRSSMNYTFKDIVEIIYREAE